MLTVRLTAPGRIALAPDAEQQEALTAAVSVLKASPAGAIPDVPPGEYRWTSDAIMFTDVEANASTGRVIMEADGFGHRDLPLPYQANLDTSAFGHEGAANVGRIDTLSQADGAVPASGFLTVSEGGDGREYVLAVALGNVPGVSVDAAILEHSMEYEVDDEGFVIDAVVRAHRWEIMGLTGTPFPAFADARVTVEGVDAGDGSAEGMAASAETPTLIHVDPGAGAKVADLVHYVAVTATAEDAARAVAASVAVRDEKPPSAWFTRPEDRGYAYPSVLEESTHAYGYFAPWDKPGSRACHIGFSDRCVCAPKSPDGQYPYFSSGGTVTCSDGTRAPVGVVAYLGGHPDDDGTPSWTTIKAAYDDPANAGLLVAVGEDQYGLWYSGIVAPVRSKADRTVIQACGVSGHWRTRIPGDSKRGDRLIGACNVLAEGFPKQVLTASVGPDVELPAPARGPVAVYDENDERTVLMAANGTAHLAASHVPASRGDVDALTARIDGMAADLAAAQSALSLLDPGVRAAALDRLG